MRCLLVLLWLSLPSAATGGPFPARAPAPPGETAWLCTSRMGGWMPKVGRCHHCSVLICPAGVCPVVVGPDGTLLANPACASYGTQPRRDVFLRETKQRIGVRCESAALPAAEVRARIASHCRRWRVWRNCQHAAAEVTGLAGRRCHAAPGLLGRLFSLIRSR